MICIGKRYIEQVEKSRRIIKNILYYDKRVKRKTVI